MLKRPLFERHDALKASHVQIEENLHHIAQLANETSRLISRTGRNTYRSIPAERMAYVQEELDHIVDAANRLAKVLAVDDPSKPTER